MRLDLFSLIILFSIGMVSAFGQQNLVDNSTEPICGDSEPNNSKFEPSLKDSNLEVEKVVSGLVGRPTTMTFVGNDILVLQKNDGLVCHVKNGILQEKPALDVEVNAIGERGLLGITSKGSEVYLFFTEAEHDGEDPIGSHVYKYFWNGHELTNGTLIKTISLGDNMAPAHIGGAMMTHIDGTVYAVIGDNYQDGRNVNFLSGKEDDTGAIIPIEPSGELYAIGIRNSFGIAVDPITGNIWDTENGPDFNDEVNLVLPKFNSGWKIILGPGSEEDIASIPNYNDFVYSDPEFTWEVTVAPTGISFVESEFFKELSNSILVGDVVNGNLYEFKLNDDRTGFVFDDPLLADLVVNRGESMDEIIFGTGFGGITDIEVGPDGMIYIVSIVDSAIYRIIPSQQEIETTDEANCRIKSGVTINLSGCDLRELTLQNIDFTFADLSYVNLSGANLRSNIFIHSNLTGADLQGVDLSNTDLTSTILTNAQLQGADLSGAEMKLALMEGVNLENTKMNSVNLKGVNLNDANLMNADLTNATIIKAILKNTNLKGANLSSADLNYAVFINSNLQEANLSGATIYRTNFLGSDLSGSNLLGVYPYSTDFTDVIFSEETKTDSCLDVDFFSRAFNKLLRELRQMDNVFLEPLETLIVQICKP